MRRVYSIILSLLLTAVLALAVNYAAYPRLAGPDSYISLDAYYSPPEDNQPEYELLLYSQDPTDETNQKNIAILKDFFTRISRGMPAKLRTFYMQVGDTEALWDINYDPSTGRITVVSVFNEYGYWNTAITWGSSLELEYDEELSELKLIMKEPDVELENISFFLQYGISDFSEYIHSVRTNSLPSGQVLFKLPVTEETRSELERYLSFIDFQPVEKLWYGYPTIDSYSHEMTYPMFSSFAALETSDYCLTDTHDVTNGDEINLQRLLSFLEKVKNGQPALLRRFMVTDEGDPTIYEMIYDPETQMFYGLDDSTRDTFGANQISLCMAETPEVWIDSRGYIDILPPDYDTAFIRFELPPEYLDQFIGALEFCHMEIIYEETD